MHEGEREFCVKDAHGRTIDYMRISLTDRCNLRCIYCMPAEGVCQLKHEDILRFDEICRVVRIAADMGIRRIRLTGGEPLVRKGVVDLVREIAHVPGIEDVSMTTNGILLARFAHDLRAAGLRRVNISLDTLDSDQYRAITRGGDITSAEAGVDAALDAGFNPVKINAVAVRSLNQDFFAFAEMSVNRPLHVRFIEYMPVGNSSGVEGCGWGTQDVITCDEIRAIIDQQAEAHGLSPLIPSGNNPIGAGPARYYRFERAQGTVGFISPLSQHFCSECNRLRLTADGMVRPCLFSDTAFGMRGALRLGSDDEVRAVLQTALGSKPDEHTQGDHARATNVNMNAIGG